MKTILAAAILATLASPAVAWPWSSDPPVTQAPALTQVPGVSVEDGAGDAPEFKRVYSAALDGDRKIEVEFGTSAYLGRRAYGKLYQADGHYVFFNTADLADKVLDPAIAEQVKKRIGDMKALDDAYVNSDPDEFTDKNGTRWKRVPKGS